MAQVDSLLKVLIGNDGDELRINLGESPRLLRDGQRLKFFFPEVGDDMHQHLLGDLLTADRVEELEQSGKVSFHYMSELGGFSVELKGPAGERARFKRSSRPRAAATEPAPVSDPPRPQVASPAESSQPSPSEAPRLSVITDTPDPMGAAVDLGQQPQADEALEQMLEYAVEMLASDLHLATGEPAVVRIDGALSPLSAAEIDVGTLLQPLLTDEDAARLQAGGSIDLALETRSGTRFRGHIYRCDRGVAAAFRVLRRRAPSLASLQLPVDLRAVISVNQSSKGNSANSARQGSLNPLDR